MLDVAATVIAAAEGARARIVRVAVGVLHNAVHLGGQLQLADPLILGRDGLLILLLLELGKLRVNIGVDRAGLLVHLGCQVGSRQPVVAAALSKLCLDAVAGLQDGGVDARLSQSDFLAQLADAALHLVTEIADAVADICQPVVDLAELLAEENFLLACGGRILAKLAGSVAPEAVAAHKDEQEEDDDPPRAVAGAEAVGVVPGHGSNVAERHIATIHS